MGEQVYRIKPLVWQTGEFSVFAHSVVGYYRISTPDNRPCFYVNGVTRHWEAKTTMNAAKKLCEKHYRKRLLEALEPVEDS